MNDMLIAEDLTSMPDWHTYSSSEASWEKGKTLEMRGDFKSNASAVERRGMPQAVCFVGWFSQDPKRPDERSYAQLMAIDGNAQVSPGEIFLVPRMRAFLTYYVPVAF